MADMKLLVTFGDHPPVEVEPTQGDMGRLEQAEGCSVADMAFGVLQSQRLAHFALLRLKRKGRIPFDVPADFEEFRDEIEIEAADADPKETSVPAPTAG